MVSDSVDWKKELVFGAISEWHLPFLLKISSKMSSIRHCVDCPLFQKSDDSFDTILPLDDVSVRPLEKRFVKASVTRLGDLLNFGQIF